MASALYVALAVIRYLFPKLSHLDPVVVKDNETSKPQNLEKSNSERVF